MAEYFKILILGGVSAAVRRTGMGNRCTESARCRSLSMACGIRAPGVMADLGFSYRIWPMQHSLPRPSASFDLAPAAYEADTAKAVQWVQEHLGSLEGGPVLASGGASRVIQQLEGSLPSDPVDFDQILGQMGAAIEKSYNTASGRYLAYIPGGGAYPAALAEYIALATNRYVGMHDAAPALVAMERMVIDWLREFVGFPEGADGLLTTGGTLSTLTAFVTARHSKLGEETACATFYTSEQAHVCIAKVARLIGLPKAGLRLVPTDERHRMDPVALARRISEDRAQGLRPFLVAATAGTTNTGALDPLPAIAEVCSSEDLWLHVDGAYGGFFRATPGGEELIPGLELADSLILDPHKGLFMPYGTGCLLVRKPGQLQAAHASDADYLQDLDARAHNFAEMSPELSREARGLRVFMMLSYYGADHFRDALRERLELARWLHAELADLTGLEMIDEPQLSIVAFRCSPTVEEQGDSSARSQALLETINGRGQVFLSSTRIRSQFVLRVCILHMRTRADYVQLALEEIRAGLLACSTS